MEAATDAMNQSTILSSNNLTDTERQISLGGGALLLVLGLGQMGRFRGLAIAGVGAALLHRGITGYCHLYNLLGIDRGEEPWESNQGAESAPAKEPPVVTGKNHVDKERFHKLKATQVQRGRDEPTAIDIAAEEVKELRRREGRSKEEQARYLEEFGEASE